MPLRAPMLPPSKLGDRARPNARRRNGLNWVFMRFEVHEVRLPRCLWRRRLRKWRMWETREIAVTREIGPGPIGFRPLLVRNQRFGRRFVLTCK
jgi:hypothetical protein